MEQVPVGKDELPVRFHQVGGPSDCTLVHVDEIRVELGYLVAPLP